MIVFMLQVLVVWFMLGVATVIGYNLARRAWGEES